MKPLIVLSSFFDGLDRKKFKIYSALFLVGALVLSAGIGWNYQRTITKLKYKLNDVNDLREQARIIREKAKQVQDQRAAVDTMLAEEPDFKIGGYFGSVLTKLNLTDKKKTEETSQIDREDSYRESELTALMSDMTMKHITELLSEFEQKQRIYIKKLEITTARKRPGTLDVLFTIATLLQKSE